MELPRHDANDECQTEEPKRGPGHPPHRPTEVTRAQVEALAGFGVSHEQIGLVIGIDEKTLRKWYRHELDVGKAKANAKMAQNIFQKALGDGPQAATLAIFWAKTQMRWKEPKEVYLTGRDGRPIEVASATSQMSDDELDRCIREKLALLGKLQGQPSQRDDGAEDDEV